MPGTGRQAFAFHAELPEDYELLPNLSIAAFHIGEFERSEVFMNRLLTRARTNGAAVMVLYALTRLAMIDLVAAKGELLSLPFLVGSFWLSLRGLRTRSTWCAFAAGLAGAVALGLKQNMAGGLVGPARLRS